MNPKLRSRLEKVEAFTNPNRVARVIVLKVRADFKEEDTAQGLREMEAAGGATYVDARDHLVLLTILRADGSQPAPASVAGFVSSRDVR